MALYLDKIIAIMLVSLILLIVLSIQQQKRQASVAHSLVYMTKKQTLHLATMLEQDLINVGIRTAAQADRIGKYTTRPNGTLDEFEFWGLGTSEDRTKVAYRVVESGTADVEGETVTLYQLVRQEEQTPGTWVDVGGSTPTLTDLRINLFDEEGAPVAHEDEARLLEVQICKAVMPEVVNNEYLKPFRQLHYAIRLMPPSLQLD